MSVGRSDITTVTKHLQPQRDQSLSLRYKSETGGHGRSVDRITRYAQVNRYLPTDAPISFLDNRRKNGPTPLLQGMDRRSHSEVTLLDSCASGTFKEVPTKLSEISSQVHRILTERKSEAARDRRYLLECQVASCDGLSSIEDNCDADIGQESGSRVAVAIDNSLPKSKSIINSLGTPKAFKVSLDRSLARSHSEEHLLEESKRRSQFVEATECSGQALSVLPTSEQNLKHDADSSLERGKKKRFVFLPRISPFRKPTIESESVDSQQPSTKASIPGTKKPQSRLESFRKLLKIPRKQKGHTKAKNPFDQSIARKTSRGDAAKVNPSDKKNESPGASEHEGNATAIYNSTAESTDSSAALEKAESLQVARKLSDCASSEDTEKPACLREMGSSVATLCSEAQDKLLESVVIADAEPVALRNMLHHSVANNSAFSASSSRRKTQSCTEREVGEQSTTQPPDTDLVNGPLNPRDRSSLIMISAALRSAQVFAVGMTRSLNLEPQPLDGEDAYKNCAGRYFLLLAEREEQKILAEVSWIESVLNDEAIELSEEVAGIFRVTVGKAKLFLSEKMAQFRSLCEDNISPNGVTKYCDLNGFWAICGLQINDVSGLLERCRSIKEAHYQINLKTPDAKATLDPQRLKNSKATTSKKVKKTAQCGDEKRRERLAEMKRQARRNMLATQQKASDFEVVFM